MIFESREEAGRKLAEALERFQGEEVMVLALPRGGVPVGFEVAARLHAPLNVLVVRKIGSLYNPEFGIGAIAEENVELIDRPAARALHISQKDLKEVIRKERNELERRVSVYRNNKPLSFLENKTIILVDDGLATGVTAHAAILSIKKRKPKRIIFASPVCAANTARELKHLVETMICLTTPVDFESVGLWYRHFEQVEDKEVVTLLKKNHTSSLGGWRGIYQ